jgi:hypothetical protein
MKGSEIMFKTITIFRDIQDEDQFKNLYLERLLPRINDLPGVICTDVTSLSTIDSDMPQALGKLQYFIETHFETLEIMNEVLTSPEISQHMMTALSETPGELFFFTGNTVRVYSDFAKKRFNKFDKEASVMDSYSDGKVVSYRLENKNNT